MKLKTDIILYSIEDDVIIEAILETNSFTEWTWNKKFKGLNDTKRFKTVIDIKLNEGFILLGQL